ncbi:MULTISPECIES: cysteine-rich KTR domain-containing protein [Anaerostipes]
MAANRTIPKEWIRCPICWSKTRVQIQENTKLKNFSLPRYEMQAGKFD